jgi:hypothetical protein
LAEHTILNGYTAIVEQGDSFNRVLTIDEGYHIENIQVKMGGNDITSTAYDSQTGEIYIASISGNVVITVEADTLYDSVVEYLQSDGTGGGRAYIDTGVKAANTTTFNVSAAAMTEVNSQILGGRTSSSADRLQVYFYFSNSRLTFYFGNTSYYQNKKPTAAATYSLSNTAQANVLVANGVSISVGNSTFSSNYNVYLFATNTGGSVTQNSEAVVRIFSAKIYSSGVLVRDFIPVRKGTTGYLLDQVSGQLFGNAGGGEFTYGNDVNP